MSQGVHTSMFLPIDAPKPSTTSPIMEPPAYSIFGSLSSKTTLDMASRIPSPHSVSSMAVSTVFTSSAFANAFKIQGAELMIQGLPTPPNVPLLRGLLASIRWYLDVLGGGWGVLVYGLEMARMHSNAARAVRQSWALRL